MTDNTHEELRARMLSCKLPKEFRWNEAIDLCAALLDTPPAPQETAGECPTCNGWTTGLKTRVCKCPPPPNNAALVEAWPRWRAMLLDESPLPGAAIKEIDAALTIYVADAPQDGGRKDG